MHSTLFKHRMNAWTPIDLAVIQEDLLNFGGEPGIFSAMLGSFPIFPAVIATLRNLKRLTKQGNRILMLVFFDKLKF